MSASGGRETLERLLEWLNVGFFLFENIKDAVSPAHASCSSPRLCIFFSITTLLVATRVLYFIELSYKTSETSRFSATAAHNNVRSYLPSNVCIYLEVP